MRYFYLYECVIFNFFQCNSKNIRMVAMNNLLPSSITLHQKYDLKGSTYKRKVCIVKITLLLFKECIISYHFYLF